MANAAATLGLLVAGVDVQEPGFGIFLEITQGFNEKPEPRGTDTTVPSLAGRIPRNRIADHLSLVLSGIVRGAGADHAAQMADYRTKVTLMRALFDPALDPYQLQVTDETGAVWTINARPQNTMWNELIASLVARVSVQLESVDPNWTQAVILTPAPVAAVLAVPVPTVTVV